LRHWIGPQPQEKGSKGGRPVSQDAGPYKERNTVERLINKLKAWRSIATGADTTAGSARGIGGWV
jgi:transposase